MAHHILRGPDATFPRSPAVNDGAGLAGNIRTVMHESAIPHLALAAFAAQLPHRLDLMVPALHVGFREMAAPGVYRQLAAKRDALLAHEPPGLALPAIAIAFEGERHVAGEAVVDLQAVHIFGARPGHIEHLFGGGFLSRTIKVDQARR